MIKIRVSHLDLNVKQKHKQSPWHIDPVPAAGEDEDDAAVAEESEEENDPDSTTESPPEWVSAREEEKNLRKTVNTRMKRRMGRSKSWGDEYEDEEVEGRMCHQSKRSLHGRKGPGAG